MKTGGFWRDMRGNMAVMFAVGFAVSAVASAVAVDAASLYHERRALQNAVDLAALTAATDLGRATVLARDALVEAGLLAKGSMDGLTVSVGRYDANPALAADRRFSANTQPYNAVTVRLEHVGELYFARGWADPPTLSARAVAAVTPKVSFSIGSRLASLEGGIANKVLDALLGTRIGLSVLDYQNLLGAQVELLAFLDALAGRLGLTVGTYDDLLALDADHGDLAAALAGLLSGVEGAAMQKLAASAGNNGRLPLRKLLDLGDLGQLSIGSGNMQGLGATISALQLLSASAGLSDGKRQATLALEAGIAGLTGIEVDLAVGEPPQGGGWYSVGSVGSVVRTAQVRARIISNLTLKLLLLSVLDVRFPLYLDVAHSEAMVAAATCPNAAHPAGTATILTRPGVARLVLGEVNANAMGDFGRPVPVAQAVLINALGIKVTGVARAEIAQTSPVALHFSSGDIQSRTIRTARTSTIVTGLTESLLGDLKLTAAGISLGVIGPPLNALLRPLAPVLDLTIDRLLGALGLALGEADVTVYGVRCGNPVLVE